MKNMAFNMHTAAQQTLKKLEEGKMLAPTKIEANTFSDTLFESKTLSDATFLINLGKEIGCNPEAQEALFESVQLIYESKDFKRVENLIQKYNVKYIFVGDKEYEKYPEINEENFIKIGGKIIFQSGKTKIYQL